MYLKDGGGRGRREREAESGAESVLAFGLRFWWVWLDWIGLDWIGCWFD